MPRIDQTLPPDCTAYIAEIQADVRFRPQMGSVHNFFGKLANVVWLHASNVFDIVKIAQQFAHEMDNMHKDTQALSYELSFLKEEVITELRVPYSARNLEIVNLAILQTKLVHKQIVLIALAKALKAQAPQANDDEHIEEDVIVHDADDAGEADAPGEVDETQYEKTVEEVVATMPTPSQRRANITSNVPSVTVGKLVVKEFSTYLNVNAMDMPFFNHVTYLANLIDHAAGTKKVTAEQKVKTLLEGLNLMNLLFLFETATRHRDLIKEVFVDSYMHMLPDEDVSAVRLQAIVKQYLVKNQRDQAINGGYVELIQEIERAERIAALGTALVEVSTAVAAT